MVRTQIIWRLKWTRNFYQYSKQAAHSNNYRTNRNSMAVTQINPHLWPIPTCKTKHFPARDFNKTPLIAAKSSAVAHLHQPPSSINSRDLQTLMAVRHFPTFKSVGINPRHIGVQVQATHSRTNRVVFPVKVTFLPRKRQPSEDQQLYIQAVSLLKKSLRFGLSISTQYSGELAVGANLAQYICA